MIWQTRDIKNSDGAIVGVDVACSKAEALEFEAQFSRPGYRGPYIEAGVSTFDDGTAAMTLIYRQSKQTSA